MISVTKTPSGGLEAALDDLNKQLAKGQKDAVSDVAKTARKIILAEAKRLRGGTLSMSGINLRALSIKTKTIARPTWAVTFLKATPGGPWSWVEFGTKPHEIEPKRGRQGRNGRPAALFFDGLYSASAGHPGIRATRVWSRAVEAADDELAKMIESAFDQAMEAA